MKKALAILMVTIMLFSLVACGNSTTESKKSSKEATNTKSTIQKESAYEKVKEYLKTEGANYQGVYTIMHLGNPDYSVALYPDGYIYFYCSYEDEDNSEKKTNASMQLYEGSVTQPVTFEYTLQGYKIEAEGTISTAMFSDDFTTVAGVKYTENLPSAISTAQIEQTIDSLFGTHVMMMLTGVDYILIENIGVSLNDLGFTNW